MTKEQKARQDYTEMRELIIEHLARSIGKEITPKLIEDVKLWLHNANTFGYNEAVHKVNSGNF